MTGPNSNNSWFITANNFGQITDGVGLLTFSAFQNLTGGSANDDFILSDGFGVSGAINGGAAGSNTLDYSNYSTPVTVNLITGAATNIGLGITNIENADGGSASDTFNVIPTASLPISVNGNFPSFPTFPGDTLNLNLTGTTNPTLTLTGIGSGIWTFSNRASVTYSNIETVNTIGSYNLVVNMAGFQTGTGDYIDTQLRPHSNRLPGQHRHQRAGHPAGVQRPVRQHSFVYGPRLHRHGYAAGRWRPRPTDPAERHQPHRRHSDRGQRYHPRHRQRLD